MVVKANAFSDKFLQLTFDQQLIFLHFLPLLTILIHRIFLFAIFILYSRESELYRYVLDGNVRTRLGVAISEVSGPPVVHIKVGASH